MICQIYPRSVADPNGDGIGDLPADRAVRWSGDGSARVVVAINDATAERLPPYGAIILMRD